MIGGNLEKDGMAPPLDPLDEDPDLRLKLGIMLGYVRREKGVSQEKAAKVNRVSRPHLSNIEQGRARTNSEALRKMAKFYTVGIQELIKRAESELPELPAQSKTGLATVPPRNAQISWRVDANVERFLTNAEAHWVLNNYWTLSPEDRTTIRKHMMELNKEAEKKFGKP